MTAEKITNSEAACQSDTIIFFDIDNTLFNTPVFKRTKRRDYLVYDDVYESLEQLSKRNCLGVFSQGDDNLQKTKISKTGIKNFFYGRVHMYRFG